MRSETQAQGSGRPDDGLHQVVLIDDADDLAAELGRANRCGIPGRAAPEDCDVTLHALPFVSCFYHDRTHARSTRSVKASGASETWTKPNCL